MSEVPLTDDQNKIQFLQKYIADQEKTIKTETEASAYYLAFALLCLVLFLISIALWIVYVV